VGQGQDGQAAAEQAQGAANAESMQEQGRGDGSDA
jgi:hypothetical protein